MGAPQYGLDNYIGAFNFKVAIDEIEVENSKFISVSGVFECSSLEQEGVHDNRVPSLCVL